MALKQVPVAASIGQDGSGGDRGAVHGEDRWQAAVVLRKDIGLAVTVEIACRLRDEVVGRVAVGDRRAGVDVLGGDGADVGLLAGQGGGGLRVDPGLGQVEQPVAVAVTRETADPL